MRRQIVFMCALAVAALVAACTALVPPKPPPADDRARELADRYLNGWLDRYPDEATVYGVAGRHHDRLPENSLDALKAWEAKEDVWLADARGIDPFAIEDASLRATFAIVREALEGSIGARVCEVHTGPYAHAFHAQGRDSESAAVVARLTGNPGDWPEVGPLEVGGSW